jgi:hypothetical protein
MPPLPTGVSCPAPADNVLIRLLVAAGLGAQGGFTPRALRARHTNGLAAFTTTMGMVAGGHRRAAHRRADAQVALAPGFAQLDVAVIQVAHLADGGVAGLADQAHFTRGHAHLGVIAFFRQHLSCSTGGAHQLPAAAFFQLDVVHHRADRDVGNGQAVARANFRPGPATPYRQPAGQPGR